jgi:hypothetical protein
MKPDQITELCEILARWKGNGVKTVDMFHHMSAKGHSDGGEYRFGQAQLGCADDLEQFLKRHDFISESVQPDFTNEE